MDTPLEMIVHEHRGHKIVEVIGDGILIHNPADALQIMMDASAQGDGKIIWSQANLNPDFFDLKTRLAGEILQKAVNYQVQIAIIGDFENIQSESLRAFISESNRGQHHFFVKDLTAALEYLGR
jgi:hypothetical protein